MIKLSLILPVYNSEKTLGKCLDSLALSLNKNFEVILINDGSTDNSLKICKNFVLKDNRFKLINKINTGVSDSRNQGLFFSIGKYIQFIDSDDFLEFGSIDKIIQLIDNFNQDLIVFGFNSLTIFNKTQYQFNNQIVSVKDLNTSFENLYNKSFFHTVWNKIYKKELITQSFNTKFRIGEDLFFNLKYIINCNDIKFIEDIFYNYVNYNISSLSRIDSKNNYEALIEWILEFRSFAKFISLNNYSIYFIHKKFIGEIHGYFSKLKYFTFLPIFNKSFKTKMKEIYNSIDKRFIYIYEFNLMNKHKYQLLYSKIFLKRFLFRFNRLIKSIIIILLGKRILW
jgi:glycosyltransferase involved in cell wall biosynthesis